MKIVFIFVVFAIAVIFGILPAKVKACKESPRFLGLANAFSGGLFLAIALIHILPEAAENYNEWYAENHPVEPGEEEAEPPVPLPFILVFCGYTFILLVDKVMFDSHALFDHGHGGGHGHGHGHGHSHGGHDHGHGGHDHGHSHGDKKAHNHHGHHHAEDPAAQKLKSDIKKSMIRTEEDIKNGGNIKKSMIQE